MLRSLAIICTNITIIATTCYYRIEYGAAPGILVFAGTFACISLMIEVGHFFTKRNK